MVYISYCNWSEQNDHGRMEIGHGLAPGAVVGHATTPSFGLRPHPCVVAWRGSWRQTEVDN